MKSRKEKHDRKNRSKRKWLVVAVLMVALLGSSLNVAFASPDIGSMLTSWFNKKTTESISEIDEAISNKQKEETKWLKEELGKKVSDAEKEFSKFVDKEIKKREKNIEDYAHDLWKSMDFDNGKDKKAVKDELDQIIAEATAKMDAVKPPKSNGKPKGKGNKGNSSNNNKDEAEESPSNNENTPQENQPEEPTQEQTPLDESTTEETNGTEEANQTSTEEDVME